jgi:hypothetical protein
MPSYSLTSFLPYLFRYHAAQRNERCMIVETKLADYNLPTAILLTIIAHLSDRF